jgi:hypothetical protein
VSEGRLPLAVLLDTCAVIWLANGDPLAGAAVGAIIRAGLADGVFVSPISAWEVGLLSKSRAERGAALGAGHGDTAARSNDVGSGLRGHRARPALPRQFSTAATRSPVGRRRATTFPCTDLLLPRVRELRNDLTAYDAVYVALAEALDAPLLTRDQRLAGAADHQARVELV